MMTLVPLSFFVNLLHAHADPASVDPMRLGPLLRVPLRVIR